MSNLHVVFPKAANETNDMNSGFDKIWNKKIHANMPRGAEGNVTGYASLFNAYNLFATPADNICFDTDLNSDTAKTNLCPTARYLVENAEGNRIYDYADFVYLTHYGKIPNNRLITLRRFSQPCQHDIVSTALMPSAEVSRMLTYTDDNNNSLQSLLSMSFGLNWKELQADFEQANVVGGSQSGLNGWMGTVAKYLDPKFGGEALYGKDRLQINPMHDKNKVYGPVDSITSTHIRDRGLKFDQEFSITFLYSLKSIDGINAKAAMIDLLSNVLATTYNNAKFWGGARYWIGRKPSKFWNKALEMEAQMIETGLSGSFTSIFNYFRGQFKNMNAGNESKKETLKTIAGAVSKFAIAKFMNVLGRPSIPVMNSLLVGDPVGEWHLTIGNPLRPIACIGNLLCTGTTIEPVSNALGYDDFPVDWKVTVKLKHAMPLDRAGIEMIFNAGQRRTYWVPTKAEFASMQSWLNRSRNNGKPRDNVGLVDKVYESVHDFMHSAAIDAGVVKVK